MKKASVTDAKSVRAQGKTSDQARLERAGVIRRGRPIPQWLIDKAPVKLKKRVSAVQALLDERHESER